MESDGINKNITVPEPISISVRELVEFAERSGDIDNRTARTDPDAMQEGARLHRKIQKEQGSGYSSEVTLKFDAHEEYDGEKMVFSIEGRADGLFIETWADAVNRQGKAAVVLKAPAPGENTALTFVTEEDGNIKLASETENSEITFIDEIKTTYKKVENMDEPVKVHLSQAKCYAYIYAEQNGLSEAGVRMSYANLESEDKRFFYYHYTFEELESWFKSITHEYAKWIAWQMKWQRKRNASIKNAVFPFSYREGQKDLAAGVYRTILRKKKLFLEAPTGVGKTISTVFPAVKAMGEGLTSKLFYGTAKTIARTVAEEAFSVLMDRGLEFKAVTITAKEKICVLEKPACNPDECPRAKGHFDRVNDCVYDMLNNEGRITRDLILSYAEKYNVCPFEMCLDVTTWADAVICDYNYLFDPNVYLRRFFADGPERDYVFLVDEAHNLVERAREMYSARLKKEDFLTVKKMVGTADYNHKRLSGALEKCNKTILEIKRQCDDFTVWEDVDMLYDTCLKFMGTYEALPMDFRVEDPEILSELYLNVRHFVNMHERMDGDYSIYSDYSPDGSFNVTLCCMDPSKALKECLKKGRSAIFFSATLIPVKYYIGQLGGEVAEDYAVYASSPFDKDNRLIMVARDVSTKYTRRSKDEYGKIAAYIRSFISAKPGNYMVFFSSYKMMLDVAEEYRSLFGSETVEVQMRSGQNTDVEKDKASDSNGSDEESETGRSAYKDENRLQVKLTPGKTNLLLQLQGMKEQEKEAFLKAFDVANEGTLVGFCVMGGIFGEGIDLRAERLIGAVIVGTGLPQVCNERELFRNYFDGINGNGFEYAYLYNGMNKVLQSAGRVIRTSDDRGAILLLDERFAAEQYRSLFPQEWYPYMYVDLKSVGEILKHFWNGVLT